MVVNRYDFKMFWNFLKFIQFIEAKKLKLLKISKYILNCTESSSNYGKRYFYLEIINRYQKAKVDVFNCSVLQAEVVTPTGSAKNLG